MVTLFSQCTQEMDPEHDDIIVSLLSVMNKALQYVGVKLATFLSCRSSFPADVSSILDKNLDNPNCIHSAFKTMLTLLSTILLDHDIREVGENDSVAILRQLAANQFLNHATIALHKYNGCNTMGTDAQGICGPGKHSALWTYG